MVHRDLQVQVVQAEVQDLVELQVHQALQVQVEHQVQVVQVVVQEVQELVVAQDHLVLQV